MLLPPKVEKGYEFDFPTYIQIEGFLEIQGHLGFLGQKLLIVSLG